jgi:hypothetical protein
MGSLTIASDTSFASFISRLGAAIPAVKMDARIIA